MSEQQRFFTASPRMESDSRTAITPHRNRYFLAVLLFTLTFISTVIAGTAWAVKNPWEIDNWQFGLTYASLVMLFLTAHEFGHYIAARRHGVAASLPYFLPMPLVFLSPFGTFGAFIRTKSPIYSRKTLFDIGAAGPLAGFVVCLAILIIGLITLPGPEYLYSIHPEYRFLHGEFPQTGMRFGDTLLLPALQAVFASPSGFMPPMNEIYHYPFLCVGWFGMFVTALNMLPFGQLDGGHILYAMFWKRQNMIASLVWWFIVILGMGSVFGELRLILLNNSPDTFYTFLQTIFSPVFELIHTTIPWYFEGWNGWLFWAVIGRLLIKLPHPPVADESPLDTKRMILGWIAILALVVSFSYNGIIMTGMFSDSPSPAPRAGFHVVQSK